MTNGNRATQCKRRGPKIEEVILWHRKLFLSDGSFQINCGDGWYEIVSDFCNLTK